MGASALLDGSSVPCPGSITAPRQLQGERGHQPCRGRDAGARGGRPAGLSPAPGQARQLGDRPPPRPSPPRGRSQDGADPCSERKVDSARCRFSLSFREEMPRAAASSFLLLRPVSVAPGT